MSPTWNNRRVGLARITKRLDRFLIRYNSLDLPVRIKQCVVVEGDSYHLPIVLELAGVGKRYSTPFKFNSLWLDDSNFIKLLKSVWILDDSNCRESIATQVMKNISTVKKNFIEWSVQMSVKKTKNFQMLRTN